MPLHRRVTPLLAAAVLAGMLVLPPADGASAATAGSDALTVEARVMLAGHARLGAWMAVDVRIRNDGPPLVGELRLAGGAQGRTSFSTPVDVPTTSDKHYRLYAQPPAFGGEIQIAFVVDGRTVTTTPVAFTIHDPGQLVVGVVAEDPQRLGRSIDLLPSANGAAPAIVSLTPSDLPERVEGWAALDRLVWQDVESTSLTEEQLAAMRGWIAGGGHLVLVGGTANPSVLSAFADDLLPFRPDSTIDVPAASLTGLLGGLPGGATDVAALSGTLARGRALATVGDRAIAAQATYGSGGVAIIGFDAGVGWLADSESARTSLWRPVLPPRTTTGSATAEDNQLVNAASQLAALALPPIGGLLALLAGYIVLIGPANYLVLRRIDRREWAWITMPVLIAVFAVGSYGMGISLRGLDVVVNEVAIVRGAPGATEGTAQVYLGLFSPSRGTYQISIPGGALLSSTVAGDLATGDRAVLDIVQSDPSRIRNLSFSSLRTLRAETATTVPEVDIDLTFADGTLSGTVRNRSTEHLERPAIALGGSVAVLDDLGPGEERAVSLRVTPTEIGETLADRILGPLFFGDPTRSGDTTRRDTTRHYVIDHLTYDPNFGRTGRLPAETPVLLAWGTRPVLDIEVNGQAPRRTGNVLYYIPAPMRFEGRTTFEGDLLRSSVVEIDALNFAMDPYAMNIGTGSVTVAYRPIPFDGTLNATRVLLGMGFGGDRVIGPLEPRPIAPGEPVPGPPVPEPCDPATQDCLKGGAVPTVEVLDLEADAWRALPALTVGQAYELTDPARYVDEASGTLQVRFSSDAQNGAYFSFEVRIEGDVR